MNINLQQATSDDWQEVGDIKGKSSSQYFKALTDKTELIDYVSKNKVFFVLYNGDKVGTVGLGYLSDSTIQLEGLNIIPIYRKLGLGQKTLEEVLKLIAKDNPKKIVLKVHPKNILALFLYMKNGFIVTGYLENYFGDGEPRLAMEKVL